MKKFATILAASAMVLTLASCGSNSSASTVTYKKVDFSENYVGGGIYETASVQTGTTVARPDDPTRDGYVFDNWFADSAAETVFDFTTPIKENTVVYANWFESATVVFVSDNDVYDTVDVVKGTAVDVPESPSYANSTFTGWYTDATFTEAFDFTQAINETTYVYAGWSQKDWSDQDKDLMETYLDTTIPFIDLSGIYSSSTVTATTLTTGDDCIYIYNLVEDDNDLISATYGTILEGAGYEVDEPSASGEYGLGVIEDEDTHVQTYVEYWYEAPTEDSYGANEILAFLDQPEDAFPTGTLSEYFETPIPTVETALYRSYDNIGYEGYDYFAVLCYDLESSALTSYMSEVAAAGWTVFGQTGTSFGASIAEGDKTLSMSVYYFEDSGTLQIRIQYTTAWETVSADLANYFPTVTFPQFAGVYDITDEMEDYGYYLFDVSCYGSENDFYSYLESLIDAGWYYMGYDTSYYAYYGLIDYEFVTPDASTLVDFYFYPDYEMVRFVIEPYDTYSFRTVQSYVYYYQFGVVLPNIFGTAKVGFTNQYSSYQTDIIMVYGLDSTKNYAYTFADYLSTYGWDVTYEADDDGNVTWTATIQASYYEDAPLVRAQFFQDGSFMEIYLDYLYDANSISFMVNQTLGTDCFTMYDDPIFGGEYYYSTADYSSYGILVAELETTDIKSAAKYAAQLEEAGWEVTASTSSARYYICYSPDYTIAVEVTYDEDVGALVVYAYESGYYKGSWDDVVAKTQDAIGVDTDIPAPSSSSSFLMTLNYVDSYGAIIFDENSTAAKYVTVLTADGWTVEYNSSEDYYLAVSADGLTQILFYDSDGELVLQISAVPQKQAWTSDLLVDEMAEYGITGFNFPAVEGAEVVVEEGSWCGYLFDYMVYCETVTAEQYAAILDEAEGWTGGWDEDSGEYEYEYVLDEESNDIMYAWFYDDETYGLVINFWSNK